MRILAKLLPFSLVFPFAFSQNFPVFPPPRQTSLPPQKHLLQLPFRISAPSNLKRPADLLSNELKNLFGANAVSDKGRTLISLKIDPHNLKREEEYTIEISPREIKLSSHDEQGAFWAVHSLLQIISNSLTLTPNGWLIPEMKIRDYPEDNLRAFMIQGAWASNIDDFKTMIKLLACFKVRYVAIEFGPQLVLDCEPSIARGASFSKKEAKMVIDYARSLGLEPIGYLNMLGHLERAYEKSPYTDHGGIMIQNEEVYDKFVFPILSEMLEIYGPIKWFHCGMDEAGDLCSWLSSQGYDSAQLLARHLSKINDFLKQRGIKMIIWHDMLFSPDFEKEIGAPIGPANGGPPHNTYRALDLIPKDVILDYWFYEPLDSYPALDWLRKKGFEVWASPWQTPFSFVRYARGRKAPTLGTIWADPPFCFTEHSLAPVPALYAWATWNPQTAPEGRIPEEDISPMALNITVRLYWGRKKLTYPSNALLIRPAEKKFVSLSLPNEIDKAPEQHYGIPFDFSDPLHIPPVKGKKKLLENPDRANFVLLPKGIKLKIDGVNRERGEDELILYTPPLTSTGTNIYGVEVAVSSEGEVTDVSDYGAGNMAIPPRGFVLSAHLGPKSDKANALRELRRGDKVAILDEEGNLIGGFTRETISAELPDGRRLPIDGIDRERGEDELILYTPEYNEEMRTKTNQWGIEVVVVEGKVMEVRNGLGDSQIPPNGFVLSAHYGPSSSKAKELAELKVGDSLRVVLPSDEGDVAYDEAMNKGRWEMEIDKECSSLFLVCATELSGRLGELLGKFFVEYVDGSKEIIPIRYGKEALPLKGFEHPYPEGMAWLIQREGEVQRFLVREWENPKPNVSISRLRFIPTLRGIELGIGIAGITIGLK
jgi:hypothetical protein